MGPFEITKEMVAQLSDEQLRGLLTALLEAEAKRLGISPKAIAVGGNQTAKDGGVDASIAWEGAPEPAEWLPRQTIFFQCKAEPMRPATVAAEMRPKGAPRPIFERLAKAAGAYIIFTTDDPTGSAYDDRLKAMARAIEDVPDHGRILLDFYGAEKVARWANQHLGVAVRVLEQSGRPLAGWRPFGDWSAPGSSEKPYVFDDGARAVLDGEELDVRTAIGRIREVLAVPGGAVRIVGISGMGKTRLAEALFDGRIDAGAPLAPSKAIYADLGLDVSTGAALLTEQLVISGAEALIVADNSNIRTHAQLAQIVARAGSRASVLTIDYDATSEQPIGTKVVRLTDNSEDVLAAVLEQRCPNLGQAERRHLAQFSGGNARIALKIAESKRERLDLSTLKDSELLARLFQTGRADADAEARKVADAASLVYAFYVKPGDNHQPEHRVLAEIAGVAPDVFYRWVETFLEWGIAQQRGPQRAIMPPPLANMLASPFVRRSDPAWLLDKFASAPRRLLASFARRLGQLHNEPAAVAMVKQMFEDPHLLGDPPVADETIRRAFIHAAPAAPDAALAAVERSLADNGPPQLPNAPAAVRREFAQLLVFICHDPSLFVRAMEALLKLLIQAEVAEPDEALRELFLERFWPVLSFTLADGSLRLAFVERLLEDADPKVRALGVEALDHMLDAGHFSSSFYLELGSQPRLTEWRPRGPAYDEWLREALELLTRAAAPNAEEAVRARAVIARHLREHLPRHAALAIKAMRDVRPVGYWDEGWRAVCDALHFERAGLPPDVLDDAERLERELRPKTFEQCFEAFVLGDCWRHHHPNGREKPYIRNVGALAEAAGRHAARQDLDLRSYLGRAIAASGHPSVGQFGRGLGKHVRNLDGLWALAHPAFAAAPSDSRHPGVLAGILEGAAKQRPEWVHQKLDDAVNDPVLSDDLVVLHAGIELDSRSVARFSGAFKAGAIDARNFGLLMMGGKTKPMPAASLAGFLRELFAADEGVLPALQVLHMRIYGDRTDGREVDGELVALSRQIVADARTFAERNEREDYGIATIAKLALSGDRGNASAVDLCRALREASSGSNKISYRDFDHVCAMVARLHPRVVLDEIVAPAVGDDLVQRFFGGIFRDDEKDAKIEMDEQVILDWVLEDAGQRAKRLAQFVPYAISNEGGSLEWSPLALKLIEAAPDRAAVLEALEDRFWTGAGWGPFSARFVRRRPLVAAFLDHSDSAARRWARSASQRLEENIRRWEGVDRLGESRFE